MNEYDGVIMKPELTDEAFSDCGIIEHGWLKDAASKVHKYVDRWRGKNGKWYYRYKKPESHPSYANWNTQRDWRAEGLYGNQNHRTEARGALLTRYQDIQRAKLNAKNQKKNAKRGMSAASRLLERQTAKTKRKNKFQYVITNNHGKEVSVAGLDLENLYSAHGRSRTGQRGSRLNEGMAAGRKRAAAKKKKK